MIEVSRQKLEAKLEELKKLNMKVHGCEFISDRKLDPDVLAFVSYQTDYGKLVRDLLDLTTGNFMRLDNAILTGFLEEYHWLEQQLKEICTDAH